MVRTAFMLHECLTSFRFAPFRRHRATTLYVKYFSSKRFAKANFFRKILHIKCGPLSDIFLLDFKKDLHFSSSIWWKIILLMKFIRNFKKEGGLLFQSNFKKRQRKVVKTQVILCFYFLGYEKNFIIINFSLNFVLI